MAELLILNGPSQWKTIKVVGPRLVIGRRGTSHIPLSDGWVSREHAVILEASPGVFMAQDLGSENGSFVNGVRIQEVTLHHQDVLRIGRTEMRFIQAPASGRHAPVEPALRPATPDAPGAPVSEAASSDQTRTLGGVHLDDPRERIRRFEGHVLEQEQEITRLAAETSRLKRQLSDAGLLDLRTGALDTQWLRESVCTEALARLAWNPLARVAFPVPGGGVVAAAPNEERDRGPGIWRPALIGLGAFGLDLARAFHVLGWRHVAGIHRATEAALDEDLPAAARLEIPAAEDAVRAAGLLLLPILRRTVTPGRDLVILAAAVDADAAEGMGFIGPVFAALDDVERHLEGPGRPRLLLLSRPGGIEGDQEAEALVRKLCGAARLSGPLLVDPGRVPVPEGTLAEDLANARLACVAGALDALIRLPSLPVLCGEAGGETVASVFLEGGCGTMGLAASRSTAAADLASAVGHAVGEGLLALPAPASRARRALVMGLIGRDRIQADPEVVERMRAALAGAGEHLPQARPVSGIHEIEGSDVRILSLVGGWPDVGRHAG